MLLKLLKDVYVDKIAVAGADGYFLNQKNYYNLDIQNMSNHEIGYNVSVSKAIKNLGINLEYITPSAYI